MGGATRAARERGVVEGRRELRKLQAGAQQSHRWIEWQTVAASETNGDGSGEPLRFPIIGGGLGQWDQQGPHGGGEAPFLFLDVEQQPELADLPERVRAEAAVPQAVRLDAGRALRIRIAGDPPVTVDLAFDTPQLSTLLALIERSGFFYVCPTTPKLGVTAERARDHHLLVRLPEAVHP